MFIMVAPCIFLAIFTFTLEIYGHDKWELYANMGPD